jgi:hypothetical protein
MPISFSPAPLGTERVHRARARDLRRDVLPPRARPVAQRQHDGADHRDQQDQPRPWKRKMLSV